MTISNVDFTEATPPLDAVMPAHAQFYICIAFSALSIAFLIYAGYLAYKDKTWLPVMFWFGGLCSVAVEAIADMSLHAIHPPVGQWNAYTTHGVAVPWHIVFAYPAYYGGTIIAMWPIIQRRKLTRKLAWIIFAISTIWTVIIEQIPIAYGIWIYYGPQSIKIGNQPLAMVIPNGASVVVVLLVIYKLAPALNRGWKQLMAIPAVPIAAVGAHAGSAAIMYNVMGMDLQKLGPVFLNSMAAISVLFGLVAVWMAIELTQDRSDTSQPLSPS